MYRFGGLRSYIAIPVGTSQAQKRNHNYEKWKTSENTERKVQKEQQNYLWTLTPNGDTNQPHFSLTINQSDTHITFVLKLSEVEENSLVDHLWSVQQIVDCITLGLTFAIVIFYQAEGKEKQPHPASYSANAIVHDNSQETIYPIHFSWKEKIHVTF